MDLNKLKLFIALASDYRYMTVMEQIPSYREIAKDTVASLEEEYGCRLFAEGLDYTVLTPKGRVLLQYAKKLLELESDAKAAVASVNSENPNDIRILSSFTQFTDEIGSFLAEKMPDVNVYCADTLSKNLTAQALGDLADILITHRTIVSPEVECTLVARDLFGVFLPSDSEFASLSSIPFEVLKTGKYVRTQSDSGLEKGTYFDWYFEKRDSHPDYVLTSSSEDSLRAAMLENGYWRFGTEFFALRADLPGFTFIPFATGACMYLYISILKQSSPLVRKVASLLGNEYTSLKNLEKAEYHRRQGRL